MRSYGTGSCGIIIRNIKLLRRRNGEHKFILFWCLFLVMGKVVVISGTPGTGKSTLAKKMVKECGFKRLDVSKHYKEISTGYNRKKQCYDIDMKKFEKLVKERLKETTKKGLVIDSHIGQLLPKKLVTVCIILTCSNLRKLKNRLKRRKYSKKKIEENIQAEIFQTCLHEAREKGHNVVVVDEKENVLQKIKKLL